MFKKAFSMGKNPLKDSSSFILRSLKNTFPSDPANIDYSRALILLGNIKI
jgi:hypothetical protein